MRTLKRLWEQILVLGEWLSLHAPGQSMAWPPSEFPDDFEDVPEHPEKKRGKDKAD